MSLFKRKCTKILVALIATSWSLSFVGQAAPKGKMPTSNQAPAPKRQPTPKGKPNPTESKRIDLKLQTKQLHEGLNLVYSGNGVKLMAEKRNNKIVGWSATDDKGNKIPTKVEGEPKASARITNVRANVSGLGGGGLSTTFLIH